MDESLARGIRRTLPAEPSRKSVRYHSFLVTLSWLMIGLLLVYRGGDVQWPLLAVVGSIQLLALLIHTSSKTIDLDRWMMTAAQIAEKYAPGAER